MRENPVQFAIVREDPEVELALVQRFGVERALLVASGGCTALTLARLRPQLEVTVFDQNPAQLALVARKFAALGATFDALRDGAPWNVAEGGPAGLNACGNFEALFRGWSRFLDELVMPSGELERAFYPGGDLATAVRELVSSRYWPVSFELFFSDALLRTMFGPAAVQNAPAASYPRYFQAAFERGLRALGARTNRFLHHALFGHYLDLQGALPPYLGPSSHAPRVPELILGGLADVPDLARFGLLSLSNIADWMSPAEAHDLARVLTERARPGAVLVARVLNNPAPLTDALGPEWRADSETAAALFARDQSLFYSRLVVAQRT